jgi:pSer/pThr/pTyr-binding forkhead associated (FHA) protein
MANLIVEHEGHRTLVPLNGVLKIGRKAGSGVAIDAEGVLPEHGLIISEGAQFIFVPLSEGAVTYVNDEKLHGARRLNGGDRIRLGPAQLVFQADDGRMAADPAVEPLVLSPRGEPNAEGALKYRCECGAYLRAKVERSAQVGRCPGCRRKVKFLRNSPDGTGPGAGTDEKSAGQQPPKAASSLDQDLVCTIDWTKIEPGDEVVTCSKCGLKYHRECWERNFGCATHGCENVRLLQPGPEFRVEIDGPDRLGDTPAHTPPLEPPTLHPAPRLPWEYALLAVSVLAVFLSCLFFGLPSMFVGLVVIAYPIFVRYANHLILAIAFIISGLGALLGLIVSLGFWRT